MKGTSAQMRLKYLGEVENMVKEIPHLIPSEIQGKGEYLIKNNSHP
jgi:hypothetical protein